MNTLTVNQIEFKESQLIQVPSINSIFEIGRVTEKALMIKCDDGKWGGDGFKILWIAKSIISYIKFNDSRTNSQFGIHVIELPDWFIHRNSKLL